MYPPDLQEQARVHQFMNMHHTLVRLATYHLMAPHVVKPHFYNNSVFLCGGSHATVADLVCYSEIGQFQFAKLFDFTRYPNLQRWLAALREMPYHDVVNAYNIELGDIRATPNTWQRFTAASEKCVQAMIDTGLVSRA